MPKTIYEIQDVMDQTAYQDFLVSIIIYNIYFALIKPIYFKENPDILAKFPTTLAFHSIYKLAHYKSGKLLQESIDAMKTNARVTSADIEGFALKRKY